MVDLGRFRKLAVLTLVVSYVLIVLGAIVRVEGAGMGCGDDWPVCNGEVIPTFSYLTTLEYLHRVIAGVVLLLSAALLWVGWRLRNTARWLFVLPLVAFGLVIAQALLGAVTVFVELDAAAVTAHLGMAQSYFGLMIIVMLLAYLQQSGREIGRIRLRSFGRFGVVAAAAVLILMLTGAYTAASPAAWACPEWPGCHGYYVPTGTDPIDIHLLHRWSALVASVAVFGAMIQARRLRPNHPAIIGLILSATLLMVVQVIVGAMNIWFKLSSWVSVTHLALATLVFSALVAAILLDSLDEEREPISAEERRPYPQHQVRPTPAS